MEHPASFAGLRVKGGFLVSAEFAVVPASSAGIRSVALTSTVGGTCFVLDPFPPGGRGTSHSAVQVWTSPAEEKGGGEAGRGEPASPGTAVAVIWTKDLDARGYFVLSFNTSAGAVYHFAKLPGPLG